MCVVNKGAYDIVDCGPSLLPDRRFAAGRSVSALILREMVTTYGRSPGGYLWAVLEPIAAIALLSFAFSLAFRSPPLGASFPLFYAAGYLPYMLFHDVSSKVATALRFSRPLLNFGAISWFDVVLARLALNAFTHISVGVLVLGAMLMLMETRAVLTVPDLCLAFAMACLLAAGWGVLNAFLFLAFPAWERVWTIATRPLFIISGVFFLFEDLPPEMQGILWFNPLFHVTGLMRSGLFANYEAAFVSPFFVFIAAIGPLMLGLLLLGRFVDGLMHT